MSVTMLSIVFVLSEIGAVSSAAMIADQMRTASGQWPARTSRDTDCVAAHEEAATVDGAPHKARSVLRSTRRPDSEAASMPSASLLDQAFCATRPLPVAPAVPLPAPTPAAIWPSVRFTTRSGAAAAAPAAPPAGRPQLSLACQAPQAANLGQQVRYRLVVRNTGDGVAEQVVVEPHLVAGGGSRAGVQRWFPIGDLAPDESREIILRTVARQTESLHVRFFASDLNGSEAEAGVQVEVHRPAVEVTVAGPGEITLGERGSFQIRVANTGTGPAESVNVICSMGDGLRLTVVDQQVQFTAQPGRLVWALGRLASGETKTLRFQASPLVAGEQLIRVALENAVAGAGSNSRSSAAEKVIIIRDRTDARVACL